MAATFSIEEILTLDGAVLHGEIADLNCGVSTDTRNLKGGSDFYLALAGENFDGHNFVAAAMAAGAPLAIINADKLAAVRADAPTLPVVSVPDTLAAYQGLARLFLRRVHPLVIAVTGSSGKTTTKEMTAAALSSLRVHKSKANENNEIGVPKTLLSMPLDTEVLVVEMGMRGLGQIAELAACARPDVAIITCAGTAHIELLGSRENIARAKCELLAALDSDGLALIGEESDYLMAEARRVFSGNVECCPALELIAVDSRGSTFRIPGEQNSFFVAAHGRFLLEDAWCALRAARAAGLNDETIRVGLASFAPVEGRGNAVHSSQGAMIVDESYNANPDSMRCAIEAILSSAYPQAEKIVVLGHMAELGDFSESLHLDLGSWLKNKPISLLVTVGPVASGIARGAAGASFAIVPVESQTEALERLMPHLGENACVMIKGSHSANLDKLVQNILQVSPL
jgi:UDP-N-acetylmuramoyl-tripeptide--D-alanyl-D-alanine ligase